MVAHACNPSIQETGAGDHEFHARPCFKSQPASKQIKEWAKAVWKEQKI
jgi:hypothetical protein